MMTTETTRTATTADQRQPVRGLPVWYFVMAGLLVASVDIGQEFQDRSPWLALLPLGFLAIHLILWFAVLRRRAKYWKAILRSPKARLLALGLAALRIVLSIALSRLYTGEHQHLILGVIMLVVVPVSAWFDQWLILRTLRNQQRTVS